MNVASSDNYCWKFNYFIKRFNRLSWSSGIMDCMLFTSASSAHALGGVSSVAFFISTDEQLQYNRVCYFHCMLCFLRAFPFISLIFLFLVYLIAIDYVIELFSFRKKGLREITWFCLFYNHVVMASNTSFLSSIFENKHSVKLRSYTLVLIHV